MKKLQKIGIFLPTRLMLYFDYGRTYKKLLNLKNPQYFGEKIQWMKLYGNLEQYTKYVDKFEVRSFVKEKIGEKYLPKVLGLYNDSKDINFDQLPDQFVLKSTNGSSQNVICKDKSKLDIKKTVKIASKWLTFKLYRYTKENQYKNVYPRILCEEYLEDESGSLTDYKFHCAAGCVFMIEVHTDRYTDHKENFYYPDWSDFGTKGILGRKDNLKKPQNINELKAVAEKLSTDFKYVRVDLYSVKGNIYFSELTFTPANGTIPYLPLNKDLELGNYIHL